jgi:hypothetical protein
MKDRHILASLTRITDFDRRPYAVEPRPREGWRTGDYVVGEVVDSSGPLCRVELPNGRMSQVVEEDWLVGALGNRAATLEVVGSWQEVGEDGRMQALTAAGIFGKATSISRVLPSLATVQYRGHVVRNGQVQNMADHGMGMPSPVPPLECPVILIIGTSMASGKTTAARVAVRLLAHRGLRVVGAKLTGAGRYRDILAMADAGADAIFDFVDVGLPSTLGPKEEIRPRIEALLGHIAAVRPDVVVAEAGASPLEPYHGGTVLEAVGPQRACTILAASDPYAAVGVMRGFRIEADLLTGLAASTSAGVDLLGKLTGLPAVNVLERSSWPLLDRVLAERLQL